MDAQNLFNSISIPDVGTSKSHFMTMEDLFDTVTTPLTGASYSDTFISLERKEILELLEKKRNLLHKEEMNLDQNLEEIVTSFANNFSTYLTMMGTGSLFGSIVAKEISLFIILIGFLVFTFFTWVGVSFIDTLKKFGSMDWEANRLTRSRVVLRREVKAFKSWLGVPPIFKGLKSTVPLISAEKIVDQMSNSLGNGTSAYKEDHVVFLRWNFIGAFVYLCVLLYLAYIVHAGR